MSGKRKSRERSTFCYALARGVAMVLFNAFLPVKYHRTQILETDAPYILIGNHNSGFDPLILGYSCKRYQVRFLGKKELAKSPLLKPIFNNLLMIPVDRHNMDMAAMRACIKTLKEGHVLGVFPEGTRYKKGVMEDMESGVGMIALRGGTKLLPAYISGKPKLFRRVHVYFGDLIELDDIRSAGVDKRACELALERITEVYKGLVGLHCGKQS